MLPAITRSSVLYLVIYSLPSGTMRSEFRVFFTLQVLKGLGRLNKLLGDVVISQGGVVPHINPEVRSSQLKRRWALLTCCYLAPA